MRYFFTRLVFALLFIGLFTGCKKYPENNLWFKDPVKTFKGGKITSYTINGHDHMEEIRAMYRNFPYNYYGKSIPDVFDLEFNFDRGSNTFTSDFGEGSLTFSKKKRDLELIFNPKNNLYGAENIFLGPLNWKVEKLTKEGKMKISTQFDYKKYEIEFN